MLYIIPTPIGNREDITLRALRLFGELDVFFCEDTRTTMKLLKMYDVDIRTKRFYSLTSFTSKSQIDQYVHTLQEHDCGLMSEAGMPGLSDPGKQLVKHCRERHVPMEVLPGANALLPAVVVSYTNTSKFVYMGFPPAKKGRQTFFKQIVDSQLPVYIYESVHRVEKTLRQLKDLGYNGQVFMSREISKMHEQHIHGTIDEMIGYLEDGTITKKGEFVLGFVQ